jgi:Thaumarchaeal output domain 1
LSIGPTLVDTASQRSHARLTLAPPTPVGRQFITLGGPVPDISRLKLLNLEGVVGLHCDAIVLLKHIDPPELDSVLRRAPDPAVPIVDFFGNHSIRRDFIGSHLNDESALEMQKHLAPVWARLAELPFQSNQEGPGLTLLRLVYSRDTPAKATFDPGYPLTVNYPLVGAGGGTRDHLESLANQELLRRRHFTRTHSCGKCGSARLHVFEACPGCGGADLAEAGLIHHYRCGCQEPESRFIQDDLLVCPKCRRELRHLGVDYGKPGNIVICRTCGAVNSEPHIHFICMDCSAVTPAEDSVPMDWYHYDLTANGLSTLREGRLPQFGFNPKLKRVPRTYSAREFGLLAMQETRTARQFRRPLSVLRVSFPNIDAVRRDLGLAATDAAIRHVVDGIVGTVRPSDFVGIGGATSIVIGFPGLAATDIGPVEDRIRTIIRERIAAPLELAIDVAEGDAIDKLLQQG